MLEIFKITKYNMYTLEVDENNMCNGENEKINYL